MIGLWETNPPFQGKRCLFEAKILFCVQSLVFTFHTNFHIHYCLPAFGNYGGFKDSKLQRLSP